MTLSSSGESKLQVLWIGCSDSSFDEIAALDLRADETIVLRNIGNMFLDDGPTCMSTAQYALDMLQVNHVIVCGHYGCGLVKASSNAGLGDPWRSKLNALRSECAGQLDGLAGGESDRRFVELNVLAQMQALANVPEVASAMGSRGLKIHGLVYDRSKNKIIRLETESERPAQ